MSKDRFIVEEAGGFYLVEEEEAPTHETPDTQGTITEHTEEQ